MPPAEDDIDRQDDDHADHNHVKHDDDDDHSHHANHDADDANDDADDPHHDSDDADDDAHHDSDDSNDDNHPAQRRRGAGRRQIPRRGQGQALSYPALTASPQSAENQKCPITI